MDYKKAKELRGKKFSELMTEKLLDDQGVSEAFRNTQSEKSQARALGIKERFDPMNIAKVLTGNSRLAPAIVGKLMGRSQEDMEYFAGRGRGKKLREGELNIHKKFELAKKDPNIEILGLIYREMLRAQDAERSFQIDEQRKQTEEADWEDKRNKELIEALTARRKKPKKEKKEKKEEKPTPKKEEKPEGKKPEEKKPTKPTEKAKETKPEAPKPKEQVKEAPKPTAEKAPPKEAPKAPEKVPPKEVPKEAPKPPPKAEAPAPSAPKPTTSKLPPAAAVVGGNKGLVIAALSAAGFSVAAMSNILANVDEESRFKPRSEELEKYSGKTLFKLYGPPGVEGGQPQGGKNKVRFPTLEDAKALVAKGPEAVGDIIYGGRMGNDKPGDGYKYRGRGFLQITGKDQYAAISKELGIDLVKDPDQANDPVIAAKIVPIFFKLKLGKKGKLEDLENIDRVNSMVGSASEKSKTERKHLAEKYKAEVGVPTGQALPASLTPTTGERIDKSSKENKDLKDKSKDKSAMQENTTTNITNKSGGSSKLSKPKGDDTNAYQQKAQQ